jgi:hypothetical protein
MRILALCLAFVFASGASASNSSDVPQVFPLSFPSDNSTSITTNVCDLVWYYCPNDPGCTRYQLSVKSVSVYANGYKVVKSENLKAGDHVELYITGKTTFTSVPSDGNYIIYDGAGKNLAAGPLQGAMTVSAGSFTLDVSFTLDAATACGSLFEFGVDIFHDKSGGSPEGMCVQVASPERYKEESGNPNFQLKCTDEGNGSWTPTPSPVVSHPLPAPSCAPAPTPGCKLNWFYCPRDPGCVTYTMSVKSVEVDVDGPKLASGEKVIMIVKGKTTLTKVPPNGSYKIYDQAGKNMGSGVLSTVMTLSSPDFTLKVPITLDAASVQPPFVEWGLDIFQNPSGSDEAMCIQVSSDAYVNEVKSKVSPPFDMYCVDEGNGNFIKKNVHTDPVFNAVCKLNA